MKRYQEFELETRCKKASTALNRFQNKFPKCYEIWGETLEYMFEHNEELERDDDCGYIVIAEQQEDVFYMCVIITSKEQIIE